MAPKRPGHIERLPSGSYRVIVYAGTDPLTGRRLRFRQTVKTEEQAHILLGKMLEQVAEGKQPETGVTVAELLRQYMTVAELDRATRQTYEGYIRRTIVPALGLIKLRKVRGPVLDMLYARLHQADHRARPRANQAAQGARPRAGHALRAATSVRQSRLLRQAVHRALRVPRHRCDTNRCLASVGPGGCRHPRGDHLGPVRPGRGAAIGQASG